MQTNPEKVALSVTAACAYLDVSRPTVYRLIDSGSLRSFNILRRRLILKSDLDNFVQERLAEAGHGG